jgi:hypothetical protein
MASILDALRDSVTSMFDAMAKTLGEAGRTDSFEMQIVVYRNYNALRVDDLFQCSEWSTDAEDLKTFLAPVEAKSGWSKEAVELVLQHANRERLCEGDMVIVIGDADTNTAGPEDAPDGQSVLQKRSKTLKKKGKHVKWATDDRFREATDSFKEALELKARGVAARFFYTPTAGNVGSDAVDKEDFPRGFCELATIISGEPENHCMTLQLDGGGGGGAVGEPALDPAALLTDSVCTQILSQIGGDELMEAYQPMYAQ